MIESFTVVNSHSYSDGAQIQLVWYHTTIPPVCERRVSMVSYGGTVV
jgi:hypothetical protein